MDIVITGVNKHFKGTEGEPDFKLEIEKLTLRTGEKTYLLGHNGSGKTVLLRLLSKDLNPTNGKIKIELSKDGNSNSFIKPAIVRQKAEDNLALDLTTKENLLLRIKRDKVIECFFPSRTLDNSVKQIINKHSLLVEKLEQKSVNLSSGQRQTLAFLSVASQKSKLLLLDEYLAATDYQTTELLLRLVNDYIIENQACILIVSHDIDLAIRHADRILILKKGNLISDYKFSISKDRPTREDIQKLLTT